MSRGSDLTTTRITVFFLYIYLKRGVYFSFWFVGGEKYDDLFFLNANVKGKRWKNGGKGEIFTEKKYNFG